MSMEADPPTRWPHSPLVSVCAPEARHGDNWDANALLAQTYYFW